MIESGFDTKAKSPAGAVGLWQFMRSTGRVYGLEQTTYEDDRKNPVKATRAAAHHLRDLFQRFGAWDLALAAYNMGYEQLLNRIDRYGTTDFNELARQRALPSETAAYVPKIIAAALVANNLERYGFEDIKAYKPLHHAELMVPGGTRLKTLARAAGVSSATLRTFNPHLTRDYVPPSGDHIVYIPAGTLSRARAALPAMLQDDRHVVSDVDVLAPDDLVGLSKNRERQWSKDENLLRLLPKPQRRSMRSMLRDKRSAADDPIAGMAEEFAPKRADRETVMYRVGTGDTLIGIAKQFAIDVDDLARDNNLEADERLREGALLKLSVKRRVLDKWKRSVGRERGVEASAAKRSKTEG
jgi:membrane-bound lytic murein transglycosylase D